MLLRRINDSRMVAISQPAHAWLAGRLAAAWGNAVFKTPQPREDVTCAIALHDIGWLEWERAPVLDRNTGFPLEFQHVPAEIHTRLWQKGIEDAAAYGAFPALLVSRHGDAIYERTFDAATARPEAAQAVNAFRLAQNDFQNKVISGLAADPFFADAIGDANLAVTKAWIVAVDTMSLNLCWGLKGDVAIDDVPCSGRKTETIMMSGRSDGAVAIHPWPFRQPMVHLSIEGRMLDGRVREQADLDRRLASAPSILHHFELVAGHARNGKECAT